MDNFRCIGGYFIINSAKIQIAQISSQMLVGVFHLLPNSLFSQSPRNLKQFSNDIIEMIQRLPWSDIDSSTSPHFRPVGRPPSRPPSRGGGRFNCLVISTKVVANGLMKKHALEILK